MASRMIRNEPPSSAQIVLSAEDLLEEILLRVPAQSVIRFKIVSKQWYSVITRPGFSLRHRSNHTSAVGLFMEGGLFGYRFQCRMYEFIPFSIRNAATPPFSWNAAIPPFRKLKLTGDSFYRTVILQSCNGLLLCYSYYFLKHPFVDLCYALQFSDPTTRFHVCNPTTKRFLTLPEVPRIGSPMRVKMISLAFDPAKSPHYKVVLVWNSLKEDKYKTMIYSSDIGSWTWRKSGQSFTNEISIFVGGVYWNGAIHWIRFENDYFFKVDDETLHMVPALPLPFEQYDDNFLVESCNHLYRMAISGSQIKFNIYEMKLDHSEWFVKYRIDLSSAAYVYPEMISLTVLTMVRGEKDEDAFLILLVSESVVQYHVRYYIVENTYETLCSTETLRSLGSNGFQFIESLCIV